MRHAPAPVTGSRLAALIAERAVLASGAVFEELGGAELLAMAITESHVAPGHWPTLPDSHWRRQWESH